MTDHMNTAIRKRLRVKGGNLLLSDLFASSDADSSFKDMKLLYGECYHDLVFKLALRVAKLRGEKSRFDSESLTHEKDDEDVRCYLEEDCELEELTVSKQLNFVIDGNPGKVVVRTHEAFHKLEPCRAVMVRSPHGMYVSYHISYHMLLDNLIGCLSDN